MAESRRGKKRTMRVLVIGATGAIGIPLLRRLRERGHEVIGTSRSSSKFEELQALGAEPIVLDALNREAVRSALVDTRPDAAIYEATALANVSDFKHFDRSFAQTNRLRTEGIDILLAAAREAEVRRIIAQSYGAYRYERKGGPVKTEDDPLDTPPAAMRETFAAMAHLDKAVTDAGGIALRYGLFYGAPGDHMGSLVRAGKIPIIGAAGGILSLIHVEDAAAATALAVEHDGPAIYNIVDDDPAPSRIWLTELAKIVGAKPPPRYPRFIARFFAGEPFVVMLTESRGASNAKAKRELDWALTYPSWRQGFIAAYGQDG
jgi:2-alkyl-3-oxoalkanoate reductase